MDNGNGTATLAGTPQAGGGGVYAIAVAANNGIGTPASLAFTLTVDDAPQITSTNSATASHGVAISPVTVTDTGYPIPKLKASGLPPGLKLTDNKNLTATIAGTPKSSDSGTYTATITAANKAGSTTQSFTVTVSS